MHSATTNWPQQEGLRIGHLNINSARNKLDDVSSILYNSNKPFHVFGFTESRLTNVIHDDDITIPGYTPFRKDPARPNDTGILVYINNSLTVKRLHDLENYGIEAVWLEVKLKNYKPIQIGFVYRNPKEHVDWFDPFSAMMDAASLDATEIILLGDFNINLLKSNDRWLKRLATYRLTQIVDKPTRLQAQTLLDHIYVTETRNILELCVPIIGCSDHLPTCITWNKKGITIPKTAHKKITYRSFAKFDEDTFLADLLTSPLNNVYNYTNPEEALDFWIQSFKSVYDHHAPFKTRRVKHTPKPKWLTKEIEDTCIKRDKFLKDGNYEEFRKQRNKVTSLKRVAKQKYFNSLVSSKQNSKSIWKAINDLTNKPRPSQVNHNSKLSPDHLNDHFISIADKLIPENSTEQNDLDKLSKFCKSKNITSELTFPLMSVVDVYNYLLNLKQSATRGPDDIDNKILKISAPVISETLTYIYNLCIAKCFFPSHLKTAKVIPLFKSGDCSEPSNYRPISILSVLSKPIEKHINKYLYYHFDSFDLLSKNQSGFRKNHSCHTALTNMVDEWLRNINESRLSGALFIDFAKAFDVIDHKLLCKKLILYGITGKSLQIITSFLNNRVQYITLNSKTSNTQPVKYGVPQGSILGPLLFAIYVNDLPLHIQEKCEIFCDDTTIHTSHSNIHEISHSLQQSVDTLTDWCKLNHMSLNPLKTKLMLLTTRQKRQNLTSSLPPIFVDNIQIEEVNNHRVLGIVIDHNLSWSNQVDSLCKTLSRRVYQLCRFKKFINLHARKLFIHAYILSSINYCSTLFDTTSETTLKPLHRVYKRALKAALLKSSSLTKLDYTKLNMVPLKEVLAINKCALMHRILSKSAPDSLCSIFEINPRHPTKVLIPTPRIDLFKTSLYYSGSILWNSLPAHLRAKLSTRSGTIRKHLFLHFSNIMQL